MVINGDLPSGKRLHNELERSTIFNGKTSTISMAIFNSYVKLPEGIFQDDDIFSQRIFRPWLVASLGVIFVKTKWGLSST